MLEILRKYNFLSEGKGMVMIWSVGVFHWDICVVIKFYYTLLCLLTKQWKQLVFFLQHTGNFATYADILSISRIS